MLKRTSQPLTAWFLLWDLGLTAGGWLGAYWARFEAGLIPIFRPVPEFRQYVDNLPLVLVLAVVCYRLAGMYEVHRLRRFREELGAVARGVGLMALAVMATSFARHAQYESRAVMVLFTAGVLVGVVAARRAGWSAVRRLRSRGVNQSHALIVGTGRLARRTARTLRKVSWTGIRTVGYVEDPAARGGTPDLPLVGPIADLAELVQKHHIEHVFIALPLNRYADARRVFDVLSQTVVDVRLIADVPALSGLSLTTTSLHGMTVIGLRESPHHGLNVVVKRAMDVLLSGVGLVVLSPLLALLAVLVKLSSPGPVLFRQERCGLNGRPFRMLKFRSMRADAEAGGPRMTAANDDRRTRLGVVLRATNLDELPQLWNVLMGDMSLVGPRPEQPVYVSRFRRSIPNYMARHAVKAGLTGWAQVNGWRGNSSLRKRVQFDLYYITHWNPLFDIRILLLTVWRMLFDKQKHAY
ncbi:MAG: undecaprenyl-phosphate glucose phosphotransferase [Gemmataceae bacterium]|nr:undecaprenyl-phosphate glucose phosphotransferase [Gemmataceae bacterium]